MKAIINSSELKSLSMGLPPLVILCDFPYGPVDRLASQLITCGLDVSIINLTTNIKAQSEYHDLTAFRHVCGDGHKNFQKLKVFQTLFEKKHLLLDKCYDTFFYNFDLALPLQKMRPVQKAGIFLTGLLHGLFPEHKLPALLGNKAGVIRASVAPLFTGFCLCTAGCRKWQTSGCANCPQLGIATSGKDECKEHFDRKLEAFSKSSLDFTVVTQSRWLRDDIQQSLIGKSHSCTAISTSVQLDLFKPSDRNLARRLLNIPVNNDVLLIGSAGLRRNKGFHVLCEALALLEGQWKRPPLLLFFGYEPPDASLLKKTKVSWKALGWIGEPARLAMVYSAADVFVSPSFQDNLPNTVNESLACGTPVVCFEKFSSEDVVIDGITGFCAQHPGLPLSADGELLQSKPYEVMPEHCVDLANKIFSLLSLSEDEQRIMRQNCRKFAERAFSPVLQTVRYLNIYRQMLGLPNVALQEWSNDVDDFSSGLTKIDL